MTQSLLTRFRHDRRGVAFIIFALMAGVLIPVAGGALDYSRALTVRERLAAAADAAALAISRQQANEQTGANDTALAILNANYPAATRKNDGLKKSTLSTTGTTLRKTTDTRVTGKVTMTDNRVTVEFSATVRTLFLPIIGIGGFPATARAVAAYVTTKPACIYMRSFHVRGSLAIDEDCPFHVANGNSKGGKTGDAFEVIGAFANNGKVTVEGNFTGTASGTGSLKSNQPEASRYNPIAGGLPPELTAVPDADAECSGSDVKEKVSKGKSKELDPGTYCKGWELSGGTLKLKAGTYHLHEAINVAYVADGPKFEEVVNKNGSITKRAVANRSKIEGGNVTIVFHDNGRFNIGSGTPVPDHKAALIVCASPPITGTYKGILVYQASSATDNINRIDGSLDFSQEGSKAVKTKDKPKVTVFDCPNDFKPLESPKPRGVVYTPNMDYDINGAFAFKTSTSGVFVARDVYAPLDALNNKIGAAMHFSVPEASAPIIDNSSGPRTNVLVE